MVSMVKPRPATKSLQIVDNYCEMYKKLFPDVRTYEAFRDLHLGLISELKRKSLPALATIVGRDNSQSLHHFLTGSPWNVQEFNRERIQKLIQLLNGEEVIVLVDETGDRKKGKTTDYVKRQYIGNVGKIENGIVAVTVYGICRGITFPLAFEVYKPKERLKPGDKYLSKPEIGANLIRDLKEQGLNFKLVLADSLYGESHSKFISTLEKLDLEYVVSIRSNHGVWMLPGERVRRNRWRKFERVFSDGSCETRYIREIIFGKRKAVQYWEITTDKDELPEESTWSVMTKVKGIKYQEVGNMYGDRTWIEYGIKQGKDQFGWADFRFTNYDHICKWWSMVMSAYCLVSMASFKAQKLQESNSDTPEPLPVTRPEKHPKWSSKGGWKNTLNNLRLLLHPFWAFNLLIPWLKVCPIPPLILAFPRLLQLMNCFSLVLLPET